VDGSGTADPQNGAVGTQGQPGALQQERWEMGDRALAEFPAGSPRLNSGTLVALADLAAEFCVSPQALGNYRYVAKMWPPARRRPGVPWGVHEWLIMEGQPAEDLMDRLTAGGRLPTEREAACLCRWQKMTQPRVGQLRSARMRRRRSLLASG
jgi:hypothetical protein